jgi:hypothetical protein
VIRYVKKLKAVNLLDPQLRFKEDGSPTSNQYNFPSAPAPDTTSVNRQDKSDEGGGSKPPGVVAQDNHPGCTEPPEQSPLLNKKQRTIAQVDLMPTEKQKTCSHPVALIVILPDNITICNHCYGLLDEDLNLKTLKEEEKSPVEIVAA